MPSIIFEHDLAAQAAEASHAERYILWKQYMNWDIMYPTNNSPYLFKWYFPLS